MGVSITLYAFGKKTNSTKTPTISDVQINFPDCQVKDMTAISSPVIKFNHNFGIHPGTLYNYAYIQQFSRYYHIVDWAFDGGLWYCYLNVDVLASFKNLILAQNTYVLRSSSQFDGEVLDTYYPILSVHEMLSSTAAGLWTQDLNSGSYVVGIINNDANAVGASSYYCFTPAQFKAFRAYLMSNTNDWIDATSIQEGAEDLTEALIKTLNNPFQYISSVIWFPFTIPSSAGTDITTIPFGWWTVSGSCKRLSTLYQDFSFTLTVPKHPQASTRGRYLYSEPYSSYSLTCPPFGTFPINASLLAPYSSITCSIRTDLVSGKACLAVGSGNTHLINSSAILGVPISIATIGTERSLQGAALTIAGGLGKHFAPAIGSAVESAYGDIKNFGDTLGVFHLPEIGLDVVGTLSGIAGGIEAGAQQVTVAGSNGSIADLFLPPRLMLEYARIADENLAEFGRPLCKSKRLGDLSGFCMCFNPDISLTTALTGEKQAITNFLKAGFFIE